MIATNMISPTKFTKQRLSGNHISQMSILYTKDMTSWNKLHEELP